MKILTDSNGKPYIDENGKALKSNEPTLVSKSITANGNYNASDDNADGYSEVRVDVGNLNCIDNQIKMYVYIHERIKSCYVNYIQSIANDVEVDFGDGTPIATSDKIGQERWNCAYVAHTYSEMGWKVITLTAKRGTLTIIGSNGFMTFAGDTAVVNGNQYPNNYFSRAVAGLVFGNGVHLNTDYYGGLYSIVFALNVPSGFSSETATLMKITFSEDCDSIGKISGGALENVKVPVVSSLSVNGFRNNSFLRDVDMTDWTSDDINSCAFGNNIFTGSTATLRIIFSSQEVMQTASVATNLSAFSAYMHYVGEEV